jgi:DeoR/GlpR family transcriptional regulator of sugar metabolism
LNRLLEGFEGQLTTSKYAKLSKCSQDTALRDILFLAERGILIRNVAGGRSTSYALAEKPNPYALIQGEKRRWSAIAVSGI